MNKHYILNISSNGNQTTMPTLTSSLSTAKEKASDIFKILDKMDKKEKLEVAICNPDNLHKPIMVLKRKKSDPVLVRLRDQTAALYETTLGLKISAALLAFSVGEVETRQYNFKKLEEKVVSAQNQLTLINKTIKEVNFESV